MPVSTLPEPTHAERTADLAFDPANRSKQPKIRCERPPFVRRRASREQGRALETLGHAVEYLVDSRRRYHDLQANDGEQDAIEILMQLNRAVFSECPEIVPFSRRAQGWFKSHLPKPSTQRNHGGEATRPQPLL